MALNDTKFFLYTKEEAECVRSKHSTLLNFDVGWNNVENNANVISVLNRGHFVKVETTFNLGWH